MEGKVQTNEYKNNVMVEITGSNSYHYSHLDFEVECEPLTDDEVRAAYNEHIGEPSIEDMKDKLKGIEGFAISNVSDYPNDPKKYDYQTLFKYKRK